MSAEHKVITEKHRSAESVTLAVFPFENLTPGKETDLFCASFCVDLTIELSRFRQFQVISHQSLQGITNIQDTLGRLGADYHITGSFRSTGEKIRVNAQLIHSHSLRMVWANRLEAPLDQMMDLQEHLLQEVLASLQDQLNYDLLSQFRKKVKTEFSAYEYWLHGMEEMKKGSVESDERARSLFRQAISVDPNYSLAYTGMSLTYFNDWSCQLWERWELNQNGAFEWAQKAIELDENNYIAAAVLGRIFLYENAYETAEHYIRRSLLLNNNDPSTLIQNAVSLVYLGHADESKRLYDKARRINPANALNYNHVGLFIGLEQGNYHEAKTLILNSPAYPWVDTHVFIGALYYHLGEYEKMQGHWSTFLVDYTTKISKEPGNTSEKALEWFMTVNPYKNDSRTYPFLEHIASQKLNFPPREAVQEILTEDKINNFEKDGDFWSISYGGKQVILPEVKGFHDLKLLLENPNKVYHCAELMDAVLFQKGESLMDDKAKKEYQKRILSLQQDIEEAEERNDFEQVTSLQKEYEELIEYLSGMLGLSGTARKSGSSIEKARSAVTWRIRSAISKIEQVNPRLGAHLSNSIRTGTTCSYNPEVKISWNN